MRRGMPPGAIELSYLEKKVLLPLGKLEKASPDEIRAAGKFRELVEVMNAASWLQAKGLVTMKERVVHSYRLARPEVARRQLPERKALAAVIKAGGRIEVARLKAAGKFDDAELAVALGWLRRKGWADVSKGADGSFVVVTPAGRAAAKAKGPDEILLARLAKGELTEDSIDPHVLRDLKSRRELVKERESVRREIALTLAGQKVLAAGIELKEEVAQPTTDLLRSGKWRSDREHGLAVNVGPQGSGTGGPPVTHDADHLAMARRAPGPAAEGVHHRTRLSARRDRLHPSPGIPSDRGRRDGGRREPRSIDRRDRGVLPSARFHSREVPSRILSVHGA